MQETHRERILSVLKKYGVPLAKALAQRIPVADVLLGLQDGVASRLRYEQIDTLRSDIRVLTDQLEDIDSYRALLHEQMMEFRGLMEDERARVLEECLAALPENAKRARAALLKASRSASAASTLATGKTVAQALPQLPGVVAHALFPTRAGEELLVELPGSDERIAFCFCPPGRFLMGSPKTDRESMDRERPQHNVKLTKGFWMGRHPVTQAQWETVMGSSPSKFQSRARPVERVSWEDVVAFCVRLGELEGNTYRLPTEAEWEYACRAGTNSARYGELDEIAWHGKNSGGETQPVGQKKPNVWGFHDMLGNVFEWCADWFGQYPDGEQVDPGGAVEGSRRVRRGGSWRLEARQHFRTSARNKRGPRPRDSHQGFRLVRTVE